MTNPFFQIAQAQNSGPLPQITNVNGLVNRISTIGNVAVYLMIALAVVYIVYSVVQYFIRPAGAESRRESGLQIMWGIIGLAIIVSIWGLVNILLNTFSTNTYTPSTGFPNANFISNTSSSYTAPVNTTSANTSPANYNAQ